MNAVKFKKRKETKYIQVIHSNLHGQSYKQYLKDNIRKGHLDSNVHFFIDCRGFVHKGRDINCVGGVYGDITEVAIQVLADVDKKLNDCQLYSYAILIDEIRKSYPKVKVVMKGNE